jgi:ethanolamine utilization protein EutA
MTEAEPPSTTEDAADALPPIVHEHGHWGNHDHADGHLGHFHDPDDELVHSHPGEPEAVILTPEESGDRITLTSVGIDIGSSTSHLMFSQLVLERQGVALSSRFKVVKRSIMHRSPVLLTPYSDDSTIDTAELSRFIEGVYRDAAIELEQVQTGATIFTGEAAKKRNAEAISALFAAQAGKFVCAVAGANLEAVLAAHGSGACALSAGRDGVPRTVLNVDIGGGTTKFAVCRGGEVIETAAINTGARLVAMDALGKVIRIEPAAKFVADSLGIPLALGQPLEPGQQQTLAETLADCVSEVIGRGALGALAGRLMITEPLTHAGGLDALVFSGGVADYVYGTEQRDFGDLGKLLGRAVAERARTHGVPIEPAEQTIRATVIGAGQYTLQVSGSTIYVSSPSLLPRRNLPVVAPVQPPGEYTAGSVKDAIDQAMRRLDLFEGVQPAALSLRWRLEPSYDRVKTLAAGIAAAQPRTIAAGLPIILVFDTDIGGAVGMLLTREVVPGQQVISIDEVELGDLDYIDLGEELPEVHAVPVVVKSLVFATARERTAGLVREG